MLRLVTPINSTVDGTWVFSRDAERFRVETRQETDDSWTLVLSKEGHPARIYRFTDTTTLARFQRDMEEFLVHTRWTQVAFTPERRRGRDRRRFPRLTDRRRWWTG
jgi:hypothetical protein